MINYSSRSEGRSPERSEVNKFVRPKARTGLSRANSSEKYIYMNIYLTELIFQKVATEIEHILRLSRLKEYASH